MQAFFHLLPFFAILSQAIPQYYETPAITGYYPTVQDQGQDQAQMTLPDQTQMTLPDQTQAAYQYQTGAVSPEYGPSPQELEQEQEEQREAQKLEFVKNQAFAQGMLYVLLQQKVQAWQAMNWNGTWASAQDKYKEYDEKINALKTKLNFTDGDISKLDNTIWSEFCKNNGNIDAKGQCVWGKGK